MKNRPRVRDEQEEEWNITIIPFMFSYITNSEYMIVSKVMPVFLLQRVFLKRLQIIHVFKRQKVKEERIGFTDVMRGL